MNHLAQGWTAGKPPYAGMDGGRTTLRGVLSFAMGFGWRRRCGCARGLFGDLTMGIGGGHQT